MVARTKTHLLWDGKSFISASPEEAKKLVDEDKAQDLTEKRASAFDLKPRAKFTGYQTAAPKPTATPDEATKEVSPADGPGKAVQEAPLKNWMAYRSAAAKAIDKPFNKVTKAEVEKWWAEGNRE